MHLAADVVIPDNARAVVACVGGHLALSAACNDRGLATVELNLAIDPEAVENGAAWFSTAVEAVMRDLALGDRPVGFYGEGVGGAAALIAACLHTNDVSAVVAVDPPLALTGMHLSGVRAASLFLVRGAAAIERTTAALPPLPGGSMQVAHAPDVPAAAGDWFDHHLRGVMRGARRELWRSA
jgi:pimeloyl-ACP methyl ester carboxylesterase